MIGLRGLPATYGGVERHVEELSARLVARGHEVVVFCRRGYAADSPSHQGGVRLAYAPTIRSKHLEALVHSGVSAAMTIGGGYDIVHFHALGPGVWAPLPRWLTGAKVVQTVHALDYQRAKWGRFARSFLRAGEWMSRIVPDAVIVVSRYLLSQYGARRGLTVHIPNGISVVGERDDSILARLGVQERRYALFVGRLSPEKAVDQLVNAFRRVEGEYRLVVAGGSNFTDDYERSIRQLASGDDRVVLGGYIYGRELEALYANAALYVQPSLSEGLPLTVLEAAAHGLPLVLSDIPAHREVVAADRPGGRLFPAGNEALLTEGLKRGFAMDSNDRLAAQEAAHDIKERFSWDTATELTESVYLQLVS